MFQKQMTDTLEKRFLNYLSTLPDSENIDELDVPKSKKNNKKADYFVFSRNLIVEVKTLKVDSKHKIDDEVDKHREREEFPLIYGEVEFQKILSHLPDGEKINRKVFEKITRSIEQAFRSADKQISATKDTFNLNKVIGLLVILNESIDIFSPDVMTWKVSQMLTKKTADENIRYDSITSVWIINESHFTYVKNQIKAVPSIIVDGPNAYFSEGIGNTYKFLQKEWAAINNSPLYFLDDVKNIKDLPFNSFAKEEKGAESLKPRHEVWRSEYKKNPYLRKMNESEVLKYGSDLISKITPYFLKGGPKPSEEHYHKFGFLFTHFMAEMSSRGLDWRKIPRKNQEKT